MLATANSSNSTIVYDTFGPCEPSKVNNKCPAIMFAAMGPCVNFNFLFVCGIPGGLDYYMLVRVKEGTMKSLDEKSINTNLNVWCRCPFLVSTVVLIFVQTHMHQPPNLYRLYIP